MLFGHRGFTARIKQRLGVRTAVETLAPAVHHPGAPPKAVEIGRRNGGLERVAYLAGGDPLAKAHDAAVLGIGGDPIDVLIGAHTGLAEVRHPRRRGQSRALVDIQSGIRKQTQNVLGDRHTRCQPGGPDSADQHVPRAGIDVDQVVVAVDRRPQTRVRCGDLVVEQCGHQRAALGHEELEAFFGSAGGGAIFKVLRRRPHHHVAVDGRADQHALAPRRRHR